MGSVLRGYRRLGLVFAIVFGTAPPALSLPNPAPLDFVAPTPPAGVVVTSSPVSLRLEAACSFDEGTLAVTLNDTSVPAAAFLPFSACSGGRKTSQTVPATIVVPDSAIGLAPASLTAGAQGRLSPAGAGGPRAP